MASVNPVLYDGFYCELAQYFKSTDVRIYPPERVQIYNMNVIYNFFIQQNWTPNAIAGMLGNMMVESSVNPWLFEHRNLDWSDPSAILADTGGMGLTQWTPCEKYYQWAIDSNLDPESGYTMCERIVYESQNNLQWSLENYGNHTWNDFITSTEPAWILADVWCWAYERPGDPDMTQRWENATWCFQHIKGLTMSLPVLFSINKRKVVRRKCLRM